MGGGRPGLAADARGYPRAVVKHSDPLRFVRQSTALADLRQFVDEPGPFLTIALDSPSRHEDARGQLAARWRSARREIPDEWPSEHTATLDDWIAEFPHDAGAGIVVVQAASGKMLVESTIEPIPTVTVHLDPLPRLASIIENRQRILAHIVVVTDRAGADIVGFDGGGAVVHSETVDGETLHIHRGHPGGWSQRRFQQRAENTWERNADDVATAVLAAADELDPVLVAVVGDVRAKHLVLEAIEPELETTVVELDAGDVDGISAEVVRHVASQVASAQRSAAEQLRAGLDDGTSTAFDGVVDTLVEHRVDTLLVNDDDLDEPRFTGAPLGGPGEARVIDAAIRAALRSDAGIVVMPTIEAMNGPLAALLRWSTSPS